MDGEGAPSKGRVVWASSLADCLEGTERVESDGRRQLQQGQDARILDTQGRVSEGRDPGMAEAECGEMGGRLKEQGPGGGRTRPGARGGASSSQ